MKRSILLTLLVLMLSLFALAGCDEEEIPAVFSGAKDHHAAAGTITDADLNTVSAKNEQGSRLEVKMDTSKVDFNTPGQYTVTYKAGTDKITTNVYLYGPPVLTYNGQTVDAVELSFAEAIASENFAKNVQVQDSFGNALEVKKASGSASFQFAEGTYEVTYEAYDKAGQGLQKTLTYRVTGNAGMSVETGKSVKFTDKELKLAVDLAGQTEVFLTDGSGRIGPDEYAIVDGNLFIYGSYLQTLGPGEKSLRLCSQAGSCEVKFNVTGEGKRASVPALLNDTTGSYLGRTTVSGYGSVRDYRATTTQSWNSRMCFQAVNPKVHGTICLDVYIYQSKIVNSSGKLEDSKNGLAEIPFAVQGMTGDYLTFLFVDKATGQVVPTEEVKMKTWYTMMIDTSGLPQTTDVAIYCSINNKCQARMYVGNMKCYAPDTVANTTVYTDEAKSLTLRQKGAKCIFTKTTYDGEEVFLYTTGNRYLPSSPEQRNLQIELRDREKQIISFQFKMLSATDANGAPVTPMMYISDSTGSNAPKSADYVIVDEAGTPVATAEIGKWYTVYISTERQRFFQIYPMGGGSGQYQVRMILRNFTTENAEFTQPFTTTEGNYCSSGMYKDAGGEWIFACASYTGYRGGNSAWQRRIEVAWEDQTQYTKMQVDFMYSTATYGGVQALALAAEVEVSVTDEAGHILDVSTLEVGKWYTATFEVGGGLPLPKTFNIYPLGYLDGTAAKSVEVVMSMKNIVFS